MWIDVTDGLGAARMPASQALICDKKDLGIRAFPACFVGVYSQRPVGLLRASTLCGPRQLLSRHFPRVRLATTADIVRSRLMLKSLTQGVDVRSASSHLAITGRAKFREVFWKE